MKKILTFAFLLTLLLSFSCSKASGEYGGETQSFALSANDYGASRAESTGMTNLAGEISGEKDSISANLTGRKLVKSAVIRIRVENLEAADASISSLLAKYDAYAASTNITENSNYYSLRVPSHLYDRFLAEINSAGRLIQRSENTEDVTLRYYDLEGRLETRRELLRTYQSYLGRAKDIEEILSVEAKIAEVQNDIDGTGRQLRDLGNRVDYATIELTLHGPASSSSRGLSFGERIKELFSSFGSFLSILGVIILGVVIYGLPILLLAFFFYWLFFGKIGLIKKLWHLVKGKKQEAKP